MLDKTIERLAWLLEIMPGLLEAIPEDEFSTRPTPEKWSKKEILGHLIDSATNNHQRFIRVQFEQDPHITYNQNMWNAFSYHQYASKKDIINFWETYNRYLVFIISQIPEENLQKVCIMNSPEPFTLEWIIEDYVVHMEHHLQQIVAYK